MKVFVMYDEQGRIRGSVASELNEFDARPQAGTGMRVHRFEVTDVKREDLQKYLRDLHTNFTVAALGAPTLVPKKTRSRKKGE